MAPACPSCDLASRMGPAAKCKTHFVVAQSKTLALADCGVCEVTPCDCEKLTLVYTVGRKICCNDEENDIKDALAT